MTPAVRPGPHLDAGRYRFTLWAPQARRATLRLLGPVRRDEPMRPLPRGYFEADAADLAPGQRYAYRLDDGPDRPDPASRHQPDGVHGPSALADPTFAWSDDAWRGRPMAELVIYELHVGTFTPEGTFDAVIPHLAGLRELGVTAVELMPVAQFPGTRNWGYDGVYPFAVQHSYGGAAGLKRLVDAAHGHGLAVLLDVVYNHLGPEGNYFRHFGPYFTDQYRTPWGEALNFDGPGSDAVRDFVLANARMWQEEFHLDGLRLDAVPCIKDATAKHVLAEMAELTARRAVALGRPFHLIAESDLNDPKLLRPPEAGGWGLAAQWSDDFHHALHVLLTGERGGYYADYGGVGMLARAYRDGFALAGHYSPYRDRRHGAPADDRPGEQFVICAQNHDQVGNRLHGDRLSAVAPFEALKLAAALLLTAPYVPLLFMGEEHAEAAPFPFFTSHADRGLIEAVRQGRLREFAAFAWKGQPFETQDERTFQMAKVRHEAALAGRGREMREWYRALLALRRSAPALARLDRRSLAVAHGEAPPVLAVHRWAEGGSAWLVFHLGDRPARLRLEAPPGPWRLALGQGVPAELSGGAVELDLPGWAVGVWLRSPSQSGTEKCRTPQTDPRTALAPPATP